MFSKQRAFSTASRPVWRLRSTAALAGLLLLVATAASAVTSPAIPTGDRNTVAGVEFLGEAVVPTGYAFDGTVVGGLSGITYDPAADSYLAISDDRTNARFYELEIDLTDGALSDTDVAFSSVTILRDSDSAPFEPLSLDPEGIALTSEDTLYISSEGDVIRRIPPFLNEFGTDGSTLETLPIPNQLVPAADGSSGPRNNLVFESVTLTPDESTLYTATENALVQDGPAATLEDDSPSRIIAYGAARQPTAQYVYVTDPVPTEPVPAGAFATNGLVELLALDNECSLLALERAFSEGVGNTVRLYEVWTGGAVDISSFDGIDGLQPEPVVSKELVLDFEELGITLDNLEGMSFGPTLPDGRPSLIVVSDNNFSDTQVTQFLAFALEVETIPVARPSLETPRVLDDLDAVPRGERPGDSDDAAIWVHPQHSDSSVIIGTLKEGGIQVTDPRGVLLQRIDPPGASYNNVDIIYDFPMMGSTVDIAMASDRANDTVAVFTINRNTGRLHNVTSRLVPDTIFGIDDGEATAYGLAAYTSPDSGRLFVYVTQASGNQIAQLELSVDAPGRVTATEVRRLEAPVAEGEVEDAQTEGVVADPDLGVVYVAMEDGVGILAFDAEPDGGTEHSLLYDAEDDLLVPDIEGLDLYLGAGTSGYLIASSQGDGTFHVWRRDGDKPYLGRFAIGAADGIDTTDESDGLDVVSAPLGRTFPDGLLVAHDGQDDPQFANVDGDELENAATNFTYVSWSAIAQAAELEVDTSRPVR